MGPVQRGQGREMPPDPSTAPSVVTLPAATSP
jgi:hypothetical protein